MTALFLAAAFLFSGLFSLTLKAEEEGNAAVPAASSEKDEKEAAPDQEEEKPPAKPQIYLNPGWQMIGGNWYYGNEDHSAKTGWLYYNSAWYYLDPDSGIMATGWIFDDDHWYILDTSGVMRTGWLNIGGNWYLLSGNGIVMSGWVYTGGVWYYLDPASYRMSVGWKMIDDIWYLFSESGAMQTGWIQSGGVWYYLNSWGLSYTGLVPWDADYYYVVKGVYDPSFNGTAKISGLSKEFSVTNGFVSGGIVPPSEYVSVQARQILNSIGWNLYSAYLYSIVPWTVSSVNADLGIAYFASYGFERRTGNCFVMASMFTALARELGYEAYQISGTVGTSPHSWVEVRTTPGGPFLVCDPDLESEHGTGAFCFTYGTPGTWRYTPYYYMHN